MSDPRHHLIRSALLLAAAGHMDLSIEEAMKNLESAEELLDAAALRYVEWRLQADPEHVFEVGSTSIAVQHPLTCRAAGNTLLACEIGQYALSLFEPPAEPGFLYHAKWDPSSRTLFDWERIN